MFYYKKMFQGPKGYKAQLCEVDLQYFFRVNSTLY